MKIIGVGKNYVNDKSEIAALKTGSQLIFVKAESTLVTDNKDIVFPKITNQLVYEVELVAKIGKTGKDISENDAASYISEIGIGIDYTAKDVLGASRENKGLGLWLKGLMVHRLLMVLRQFLILPILTTSTLV